MYLLDLLDLLDLSVFSAVTFHSGGAVYSPAITDFTFMVKVGVQ